MEKWVGIGFVVFGLACSDGGGGPTPVSFKSDVMPIIARGCSFVGSCHGPPNGQRGLVLDKTDAKQVREALVNVASDELPAMPYVTPGDPAQSYLMYKLDNTQKTLDAQCDGKSCLESMPLGDTLELAEREIFRRWILDGALDN